MHRAIEGVRITNRAFALGDELGQLALTYCLTKVFQRRLLRMGA